VLSDRVTDHTLVDLKSNDRAQAESVSQIQLHIYALGYRELTGHRADYVEVYDLDGRKRSARRVDDGLLRGIAADVRAAADALRKGVLRKRPSKKRCGECDFRMVCSSGAKVV
jgi:DNA helicase-2/ATP-dependent DNA helicase PcrA